MTSVTDVVIPEAIPDRLIWKFPLELEDVQTVEMPHPVRLLHVALQDDQMCLWAMVTPDGDEKRVRIRCYRTGQPVEGKRARFLIPLGTVLDGSFVWHFFSEPI